MNRDQKLLLVGGVVILALGILNIATTSVPNDPVSAVLFPLSILAVFFGVIFIAWSAVWMALQKFDIVK